MACVPCESAVGIRENPEPCSTCTLPPSWSAERKAGTEAVASAGSVSRCSEVVTERIWSAPLVLRPMRMTLPTCCSLTAERSPADTESAGVATMKSCPMRWSRVIAACTWSARLAVTAEGGAAPVVGAAEADAAVTARTAAALVRASVRFTPPEWH